MDALPTSLEGQTTLQQHLSIRILGSPILTWNNTNLAIPRHLVRALMFRLACDSEPVARGHLQLLFWPDMPESIARPNLSHLLIHLSRSLPVPQILVTSGDELQLDSSQTWCDVVEIGDAVTFADGTTTRSYTVLNLSVTGWDVILDTVIGLADAGTKLVVWPHEHDDIATVFPTTDLDGTWTAEFVEVGFDLVENMGDRAQIYDEMGNATAVDWCVPPG